MNKTARGARTVHTSEGDIVATVDDLLGPEKIIVLGVWTKVTSSATSTHQRELLVWSLSTILLSKICCLKCMTW
jgi:hypothetical protein